jgi:Zn ribbon nucleic-acid-binding protein
MNNRKRPMIQAECDACEQILTLEEAPIGLVLCMKCETEYEEDLARQEAEIAHSFYADQKN